MLVVIFSILSYCLLLSCSFLLSADRDDDDEEEKRMLELDPTVPTTFTRCGLSAMHSWAQLDGYEDVSNILSGEKTQACCGYSILQAIFYETDDTEAMRLDRDSSYTSSIR